MLPVFRAAKREDASLISALEGRIFSDPWSESAVLSHIDTSFVAELDGRAVSEEVVADIFAKFCVGK